MHIMVRDCAIIKVDLDWIGLDLDMGSQCWSSFMQFYAVLCSDCAYGTWYLGLWGCGSVGER